MDRKISTGVPYYPQTVRKGVRHLEAKPWHGRKDSGVSEIYTLYTAVGMWRISDNVAIFSKLIKAGLRSKDVVMVQSFFA